MEELLKQLYGYGPVGLAFALCFYSIYTLYTRNTTIQDKRLEENRETLRALHDAADAIKSNTAAIQTLTEVIKVQRGG